jgi:hypothetical protein
MKVSRGRPSQGLGARIRINLTHEQRDYLEMLAKRKGETVSVVLREIIQKHIHQGHIGIHQEDGVEYAKGK